MAALAAVVVAVAGACVSVTPGGSPSAPATSASTTLIPTAWATATAAATATSLPTAAATPAATTSPSPALSAAPSSTAGPSAPSTATPSGSPAVGGGFGADTPVLQDDFEAGAGDWGIGSLDEGSAEVSGGALRIAITQAGVSLWSPHTFTPTFDVLRVEGSVTIEEGTGAAGLSCGDITSTLVGGVVTHDGQWHLFESLAGATTFLESGTLEPPPDGSARLTVECAGTNTGALRLRLQVDGVEAGTFERATGPDTFDRAAAYAEADAEPISTMFDDIAVSGGSAFGGFPLPVDPAALADLLTHVPTEYAAGCGPTDPFDEAVIVQVECGPAGPADEAVYALYPDVESLQAGFDRLAAEGADQAVEDGTCETGPARATYSIGDAPAGEVACFTATEAGETHTVIFWTDEQLLMLAGGRLEGEDFGAVYRWWLDEAGPVR
jgi:hypothetical protein